MYSNGEEFNRMRFVLEDDEQEFHDDYDGPEPLDAFEYMTSRARAREE